METSSKDTIPEEISKSHSSAAELSSLVGCYAVLTATTLAYRRAAVPSSAGVMQSRQSAQLLDNEDEGSTIILNAGKKAQRGTAQQTRRLPSPCSKM